MTAAFSLFVIRDFCHIIYSVLSYIWYYITESLIHIEHIYMNSLSPSEWRTISIDCDQVTGMFRIVICHYKNMWRSHREGIFSHICLWYVWNDWAGWTERTEARCKTQIFVPGFLSVVCFVKTCQQKDWFHKQSPAVYDVDDCLFWHL